MQRKVKRAVALLLIVAAQLCGCTQQKALTRQIATADQIIVSNIWTGFTLSMKGEEAKQVVQAVSTAKKESNPGLSTCRELQIAFFQGTNFLGAVESCRLLIIGINHTTYIDRTGIMETLSDKLREEALESEIREK
jgi:hypothetical protein